MMGALNDTMLERGGDVIAVLHEIWMPNGGAKYSEVHPAVKDVRVASGNNLSERKEMLKSEADAFIVLPGGPGTYEEFLEIVSERQIGFHSRPLVLLDVDNFYSGIIKQFDDAYEAKLLYRKPTDLFKVVGNAKDAVDFVMNHDVKSLKHVASHESSSFSSSSSSSNPKINGFGFGFGTGLALSMMLGLGLRSAL